MIWREPKQHFNRLLFLLCIIRHYCEVQTWYSTRIYRQLRSLFLSRNSDVLRAGRPGFDSRQCKIFLFSTASTPTLGPTQSPIQWASGAFSLEAKRAGREADFTFFMKPVLHSEDLPVRRPPETWRVKKVKLSLCLTN
jgi:hypothetical protein